jgi:SAM-dependent methyltransferase
MRRVVRPEILDSNHCDPRDVADSLVDLQRINRWFGGISTTAGMINTVVHRTAATRLHLLDIASATGDIPAALQQRLANRGIELSFTLLDRDASHFDGVPAARVRADALQLPFQTDSFDLVACSLFAHHLEPGELPVFVREALRVARIGLLINDLQRSYLHLLAVYAGSFLFRRITRHDSVASVRRSYTIDEMRCMLNHVYQCEIRPSYLFRYAAIVWK